MLFTGVGAVLFSCSLASGLGVEATVDGAAWVLGEIEEILLILGRVTVIWMLFGVVIGCRDSGSEMFQVAYISKL